MRKVVLLSTFLFAQGIGHAQPDLALLASPPGDYLGQGLTYLTTQASEFVVSRSAGTVRVSAFGFLILFDAPGGAPLAVGTYSNAVSFPGGDRPALRISGNGRSCLSTACGEFEILEIEYDGTGGVGHFWGRLAHQCHCGDASMTGEIRYRSRLAPPVPPARVLRVPDNFPSIQSAIDATSLLTLETVLVGPGIYHEGVHFRNKRLRLVSEEGPGATFIVAPAGRTGVDLGGTPDGSVVEGFTVLDSSIGFGASNGGSIRSNVVLKCGIGISCGSGGSPLISGNRILRCTNGAVALAFSGSPILDGNVIEENEGGGIGLWVAGSPTIRNNIIRRNRNDGIAMIGTSFAFMTQNLIVENGGNGISWLIPLGPGAPQAMNNVIVGNAGAGIDADGYDGGAEIFNNIVVGDPALHVGAFNDGSPPIIRNNNIYSLNGSAYAGLITNLTGVEGNISADPFFVCQAAGDFHLLPESPCIDQGRVGTGVLATDFDGHPRIRPGQTNAPAKVDQGAFEFDPTTPTPVACPFLSCPSNIVAIAPQGTDRAVVVYPLPAATPGASISNSPPSGSSFPAGTSVVTTVAVSGTNRLSCAFTVTVLVAPTITSPPQSGIFVAGLATNLSVTATGTAPLKYQWMFERFPIARGTEATLLLADPQLEHEGFYQVAVSNVGGSVTSAPVLVRIVPSGPVVAMTPSSSSAAAGSNVTLKATATGSSPLTFQWFHDGLILPGRISSDLVISNAQTADAGTYSVVVSNVVGLVTNFVTLTVVPSAPRFVLEPVGGSVPLGIDFVFTTRAMGTEPIYYQWWRTGTPLLGATQASLILSNITASANDSYAVIASNSVGNSRSRIVSINVVGTRPQFTIQPTSVDVLEGAPATLSSVVTGTTPISYRWFFNGVALAGQTNPTLIVPSVTASVVGDYFLVASNALGRTTSSVAQIRINRSLVLDRPLSNQVVFAGSSVVLAVAITASNAVEYGWAHNAIGLPATNSTLTISNIGPAQAGYYTVTIRSSIGAISSTGRVSVFGPPSSLIAWGDNSAKQTGVPAGLRDVVAAAGGDYHTLALRMDGSLAAWGYNGDGQTSVPQRPDRFVAIAAGANHNLAMTEDGSVVAWGRNDFGQSDIPASARLALSIAAGDSHSVALLASGTPLAWGDNSLQQSSVPQGLRGVRAIAAGRHHNLALGDNGTVAAWGFNAFGQSSPPQDLTNAVAVAAGYAHSVALRSDGTVVAWGGNSYGQTNVPAGLETVVAIAAGDFHTLALRVDGSVVGWGENWFGETTIPAGLKAGAIAAGYFHDMALVIESRLRISRQAGHLLIEWIGPGTLQSAPLPDGSYQDIPTPNQSYILNDLSDPSRFFRLRH